MAIIDVLRNLNQEIAVFWNGRFDEVPDSPGVYAWFYPLRIVHDNILEIISEFNSVHYFDALRNGSLTGQASISFAWDEIEIELERKSAPPALPAWMIDEWARIRRDPLEFRNFRESLMRASLLMPPLYVGKTTSLLTRCRQHTDVNKPGTFHARFRDFALKQEMSCKTVSELLFCCIRTRESAVVGSSSFENVLEEILKRTARPPYGYR